MFSARSRSLFLTFVVCFDGAFAGRPQVPTDSCLISVRTNISRHASGVLSVSAGRNVCAACNACAVGPNPQGQNVDDSDCGHCANGKRTWWPCDVEGLCKCAGAGMPTQAPSPTPVPSTTSVQSTTASPPAATPEPEPESEHEDCRGCSTCVAVEGNRQSASDAQCAPCALGGQTWWPCKLDGDWSTELCRCAGITGGGPSPQPAPLSLTTAAPTTQQTTAASTTRRSTAAPSTPSATTSTPIAGKVCTATGPACDIQPGEGISSWFTKDLFDQMFPNICNPACEGCQMLKYECLVKATSLYPRFANSSTPDDNKRELAAWLGEMSQETTGGGCRQSSENPDGTCSCGPMWCDGQAGGGCASWGLCFVEESSGQYWSASTAYPPRQGKEYKGRGPKQLSYNYNYGQFSEQFCGDKDILLDNPEWVASNPTLAWASSMWFWFTGGACGAGESCKPSCHDVFLGYKPMCAGDRQANRRYGLGWVTNVINGGLECGGAGQGKCDYRVHSRVRFYKHFCGILGVSPLRDDWTEDENLFCHDQQNYATSPPQTCV